mgnify:CR=1 FL=1
MNSIDSIKIVSIDDKRPPMVRKEDYIDLFFKLSQEPPSDWCDDFNSLGHQLEPIVKIDKRNVLILETWIRDMSQIPEHFKNIKQKIIICNEQYLEKIKQKELAALVKNAAQSGQDGAQNKLNLIMASLDYDN